MAKISNGNDAKSKTLARIKRTEAYAERVRTLFAATVNEILALNKSMPELEVGEMFSFDAVSVKKQHEVERLLRQLHSIATMAIQSGIKLEWAQANAECDKLVQSCFGKRALSSPTFAAWTKRNEAAMSAFIARSENGLNLSQRVWKSCRQLRDEMEVAITVAIGDGTSAATMSRSVRKYLNDADLMFRRFRYKDTVTGEWKRKWKKRVIGKDGKVRFVDYDKDSYLDDWTGSGYYKSSAQNAMRVARTETNIAYRRADNQRWQQMDFVLGQRVQLSRNHPKKDICDKLAGDYPKEFVFDGWHPQCFCYVTPILIDEDELAKEQDAFLRGETYTPRGKRITQYPDNFKQWVSENADNIAAARERGTEPYFIRNNGAAIDNILNPKQQLTPLEIAEQRHANRTPEQEEAIRLKWQERQERIAAEKAAAEAERLRIERINNTAHNVLKVATTRFADFGLDTVALEAAVQSGDTAIINAETRALAQIMAKKQQQIKQTASNVLKVAANFSKDIDASTVSSLSNLLNTGKLSAIRKQTRVLAQQILKAKKAQTAILPQELEKITVPDWQFKPESKKASAKQRLQELLDKVEHFYGINDANLKSSIASARRIISLNDEYLCESTLRSWSKYKTFITSGDAAPNFMSINHLHELRKVPVSAIPMQWRAAFNDAIKSINMIDFATEGYHRAYQYIEKAYNIYKLAKSPYVAKIGIDNVSVNMPFNLLEEYLKAFPDWENQLPSKTFWDSFSEFHPLVNGKKHAHYSPQFKYVQISLKDKAMLERLRPPVQRNKILTHEFGHAFDDESGLRRDADLGAVYDNFVKEVAKDNGVAFEAVIKKKLSDFEDDFDKRRKMLIEARAEARLKSDTKRESECSNQIFELNEQYKLERLNLEESLGAFSDCLGAALAGKRFVGPRGHSGAYFKSRSMQLAEFIAHASENYWGGNIVFKEIAPQIYQEMCDIIKLKMAKIK